jgi:hypothetical protein
MIALRLWLGATAVALALLAVWAFAPVLLFMVLLLAALGIVAAAMIDLAHRLPGWIARMRAILAGIAACLAGLIRRLRAGHERP